MGTDAVADRIQMRHGIVDVRRVAGLRAHLESERQSAIIDCHQNRIRAGLVDPAVRVQRFLRRHAVIRLDALQRQAVPRRAGHQDRNQKIEGSIADEPQAERDQGRQRATAPHDGATQPGGLRLVQGVVGQRPRQGPRRVGGGQRFALGGEIIRFRGQPGQTGVKALGHAVAILD